MSVTLVDEYRVGRNFVRVGDRVKVRPLVGPSFTSRVRRIEAGAGGVCGVEVVEPRTGAVRTIRPERVFRLAQTRNGVAR